MKKEWYLFQLVDSALPTGAFAHSFGLETAFQEEKLTNPVELYRWAAHYISGSLAPTEGIAVSITYNKMNHGFTEGNLPEQIEDDLQRLDQKLTVSKMPSESRQGGIKLGKRYLKNIHMLYPDSGLQRYVEWIDAKLCYGNSAIVHGWISAYLGVSPDVAVFTHLYSSINNLLQSALRLTAVGQTDVQIILQKLYPVLVEEAQKISQGSYTDDDLFSYALAQEIEAMRHEVLYSRLFMS